MKKIIYFGIAFLPDKNALALRALAIGGLIKKIGYEPILIGMDTSIDSNTYKKIKISGIDCYIIRYPSTVLEWMKSMVSIKIFLKVFDDIGVENIYGLIVADYRFGAMLRLSEFCKRKAILFVADIMDWPIMNDRTDPREWIKVADSWLRINALYPFLKRRICICRNFAKKYQKQGKNVVIPMVQSNLVEKPTCNYEPTNKIIVAFAGQPGKGCYKERIDWLIRAIDELNLHNQMEFRIAGISKEQFSHENPNLVNFLKNKSTVFMGKISHSDCMDMISKSDYTVLLREKNRLSEYGFSTKISEAFMCGTPLLATDTSDTAQYVKNGINGFVCEGNYQSFKCLLEKVSRIPLCERVKMHENMSKKNPLLAENYLKEIREIL